MECWNTANWSQLQVLKLTATDEKKKKIRTTDKKINKKSHFPPLTFQAPPPSILAEPKMSNMTKQKRGLQSSIPNVKDYSIKGRADRK